MFVKNAQNVQKSTCPTVSFLKKTLVQVFSCEFCKIFKITFLYRTPLVAAPTGRTVPKVRLLQFSGKYMFWKLNENLKINDTCQWQIFLLYSVTLNTKCILTFPTMDLTFPRFFPNKKSFQKQPSRTVLKNSCSENMQQIYRKTTMPKCDFDKNAKQLRHECVPVNLLHVFSIPFPKSTSEGLLLTFINKYYCH